MNILLYRISNGASITFDVDNIYVAYGSIFVTTKAGNVFLFSENDYTMKIEVL